MKSFRAAGVVVFAAAIYSACGSGPSDPPDPMALTPPASGVLSVGIVVPDDGQVLNGWLYGDEHDAIVVLSHMRPDDQTAWEPLAQYLAENGYAALTFDFRGFGISPGSMDFEKLDDDLAAAVSFMRTRGKQQIFLIGASMGGTASLVVAAEDDVDGVVSISAPFSFEGHSATEAIASVTAPTLLVAAENDTAAMVSLEELEEAASGAEVATFAGGDHGTALFAGEQASAVQEEILRFLRQHAN